MRESSLVFAALLVACGSSEPAPQPDPESPRETEELGGEGESETTETPPNVDGFFSGEGAPSPTACTAAEDCLGDTIPQLEQPCCNNPQSLRAYSRDYRRWVSEYRADHCEGVTCPPPPAPSLPPDCMFQVECLAGQCRDTCP